MSYMAFLLEKHNLFINKLSYRICNPTGLFADFKSAIKPTKDCKFFMKETFHETYSMVNSFFYTTKIKN